MKLLSIAVLAVSASAFAAFGSSSISNSYQLAHHPHALVASLVDEPPLDCPMCGGDVRMHQKRTRFFVKLQLTLFLWRFSNTSSWR